MLKRALLVVLMLAAPVRAQEDDAGDGLRRPQQLTVGVGDQFLGQLAPDGKTLFFASNRNTASEIFTQDLHEARATLLFDEGADVTWPRVSPDGKLLLYISFRDRASGQLCVRELPAAKQRRCLDDGSSALQAEWMSPARVALLSRGTIQGDLRVAVVEVAGRLSAKTLVERNLTGPALSPDGRWLIYLPVERYVEQVGPGFAARAATRLEAMRLGGNSAPVPLPLDLPGVTGQPAFSRDGKSLYVAQFFDDSNQDGVVDASDHGVLFRVPFPSERDDAPRLAAAAQPVQLSDASWNCQYPAPAAAELIATCSRPNNKKSSLAVYSLPLDGAVPADWSAERLRAEVDLSTRSGEQQLLLRHLLARESSVTAQRMVMMRLIRLHLLHDELDPAEFYARHVSALKDPATAGMASGLRTLIEQRRALHDRERGRLSLDFADGARKRMESLAPNSKRTAVAQAFDHLVRSEIADTLGDLAAARSELEAARLEDVTLPSVLQAYYDRAESLYRQLDDRDALVAACRKLAEHPSLPPDSQLPYARAAMRALTRGLPLAEAEAALMRQNDAPDSELAFARDLERTLMLIRDDSPPPSVDQSLLALYRAQSRLSRKRQVMLDAVRRASDLGAERVVEVLAEHYVDDVQPGTEERRRAERLYQRVLLGRAYRRLAARNLGVAQADFAAVAQKTRSLEGYIGAIDAEARQGATPESLDAKYAHVTPDEIGRFVKAYLLARKLPHLDGPPHQQAVAAGIALLRGGWNELKSKREAQALFGALLHERFLHDGDRAAAQRANVHYLIALDLVRSNQREKAMVLGQLALLHSEVGNHRIALGYLDDREKLPYADNGAGLAVRLAKARTLLHVGREADAAKVADEALTIIERKPRLAEYRVLAIDRSALYHLAADEFERALQLYDEELPLVDAGKSERNRVVARLGRAAAALGAKQPQRALDDLSVIDERLSGKILPHGMRWPHSTDEEILRSYRIIAAGLRANAHRALGQPAEAARALEIRRALFAARLKLAPDVHENLRAMTLVETRLADNAGDRGDAAQAAAHIGKALAYADATLKESGTPMDSEELDVLWFAAELRAARHPTLPFNLTARLKAAYDKLLEERDPTRREYLRWFEIYLSGE